MVFVHGIREKKLRMVYHNTEYSHVIYHHDNCPSQTCRICSVLVGLCLSTQWIKDQIHIDSSEGFICQVWLEYHGQGKKH